MKQTLKIISIPPDKQVQITVGGAFYQRLNKLALEFGDNKTKEELTKALADIKKNNTEGNSFAFNFETLLILLKDVETAFKEAGHTVEQDIEADIPDEFMKDQS